jgi:hypothetical protein
MNKPQIFDALLLLARPAAGKSEIIHYLKNSTAQERKSRFHIGEIREIDDFPMLWTWFEEDDLLQAMGHPRLHSTPDGYFLGVHLWDLLIQRICQEYQKAKRDDDPEQPTVTTLIEFARGKEHGGWRAAFSNLSPQVLEHAAILYLNVSYTESFRKNRARFNPDRPDSILQHGLSDEKMERLYKESDWDEVVANQKEILSIQGVQVPFVVFENEDDVTTPGGERLGRRLEESLSHLWNNYLKVHAG